MSDELDESKQELKNQMQAKGEKTLPAIEQIVGAAIARQDGREVEAGPVLPYVDGIIDENLGGNCPVQGEGWFTAFDGTKFGYYFRARGDKWEVEISRNEDLMYEADNDSAKWFTAGKYGTFPDAGWMPRAHAVQFINAAYEAWFLLGGSSLDEGGFKLLSTFNPPQPIK